MRRAVAERWRHARAERLLPWLVNGTLGPDERGWLERHLDGCARCRRERAAQSELAGRLAARPAPEVRPHPARLETLLERVEPRAEGGRRRPRARLSNTVSIPRGVWWILGAQALAVCLIAAVLIVDRRLERPRYRTLSAPAEEAVTASPRLRMVFAPELSEAAIREILESVNGRIVDGPTPRGVYTVELPAGTGPRVQAAAEGLRRRSGVRLVEVVR